MKLLVVAAPLFVFGLVVSLRALRGRPFSRPDLSAWVALMLLVYVTSTACVGIFWVAKMALPKLDLHYLLGYCMILLTVWHVALQIRVLEAFLRRHSPRSLLANDGRRFLPAVRRTASIVLGAMALTPMVWVLALEFAAPAKFISEPQQAAALPAVNSNEDSTIWIARGTKRQSALEYLYQEASHTRTRPLSRALRHLRVGWLAGAPSPPPCKEFPKAPKLILPPITRIAGVTLHDALQRSVGKQGNLAGAKSSGATTPQATSDGVVVEQEATRTSDHVLTVSKEVISQVLHYANGVTTAKSESPSNWHRAAPSAGARYPTDIYVAVRRVESISPGIYYYNPHEHSLLQVMTKEAVERLPDSTSTPRRFRDAPVSFVLGVTFDRTVSKYDTHGYRYVTVDTGHVAANLKLAAAALGLQCGIEPLFDDDALLETVGGRRDDDGMLLAMPCTSPSTAGSMLGEFAAIVPQHTMLLPPADPDLAELTRLSHHLTSWHLIPGAAPKHATTDVPLGEPPRAHVPLPKPDDIRLDLFEAISQRRSYRQFSARNVSLKQLAGVLRDAFDFAVTTRGQRLLELYVAVSRVEGLQPGVYRYLTESHALELVELGDSADTLEIASYSQRVLGQAAFVLMWAMRTKFAEQLDGTRGYRHALLDAGLGGENAYLSASARGLGICGVGAFDNDRVNSLIERRNKGHLSLYLMGIGQRE